MVEKKKYAFNSLEFLNASIDEIYYRKKHYVSGIDLLNFKASLSSYFVEIERVFKSVYFSGIMINESEIDMEIFKQNFPFIYNKFANKSYLKRGFEEDEIVNGIVYYTYLIEQLRNINLHAVISTKLSIVLNIDDSFIKEFPLFSDKVIYTNNGVLTIAGMLVLIMPLLHPKRLKYLIGYICQSWSEELYGCEFHKCKNIQENIFESFNTLFLTNYEIDIRKDVASGIIIKDIFGREYDNLQLSVNEDYINFELNLSQRLAMPRFAVLGSLIENEKETRLIIKKGSNIGVYFEEDHCLEIKDKKSFCSARSKVPPFLFVAYLYHNKVDVFEKNTIEARSFDSFVKMNNPKFFRDKNILILCYGEKNADIREINKAVSENLLGLFLDFEEKIIFQHDIPVYGGYSRFSDVTNVLRVPNELKNKLIACRNFCSHEGMLDMFQYSTSSCGYIITLPFICKTFHELDTFLNEKELRKEAYWIRNDVHRYIFNNIIGVKYKRIFEASILLFRQKAEKIPGTCLGIQKSLGAVKNSYIDVFAEEYFSKATKEKFVFYLAPFMYEKREFSFTRLRLIRILASNLEIRGTNTETEVLEFFKTPTTNLSKISKNGKGVELELVEEKDVGIITIYTYVVK